MSVARARAPPGVVVGQSSVRPPSDYGPFCAGCEHPGCPHRNSFHIIVDDFTRPRIFARLAALRGEAIQSASVKLTLASGDVIELDVEDASDFGDRIYATMAEHFKEKYERLAKAWERRNAHLFLDPAKDVFWAGDKPTRALRRYRMFAVREGEAFEWPPVEVLAYYALAISDNVHNNTFHKGFKIGHVFEHVCPGWDKH